MPSSSILFLTICSLNKKTGGRKEYNKAESLSTELETGKRLLKARKQAIDLLFSGRIQWQGIPLKDLEYNKTLTYGEDFGENSITAEYMPAIYRYDGRFYGALSERGRGKVLASKHHTLIQSGLYGLLNPREPIQLYSLPIENESLVQDIWKKDNLLTIVLIDYIKSKKITRIFDLTSRKDYREIFDWTMLRDAGVDVLHCFSIMGGGDDALIPFGKLLNDYLLEASENELISIKSGAHMGNVQFLDSSDSPQEYPREVAELVSSISDEMKKTSKENMWQLIFTPAFQKDLFNLKGVKQMDLVQAIIEISESPRTPKGDTIKVLQGELKGKFRYRIGDFRLVYEPDTESSKVFLLALRPRGGVYD